MIHCLAWIASNFNEKLLQPFSDPNQQPRPQSDPDRDDNKLSDQSLLTN